MIQTQLKRLIILCLLVGHARYGAASRLTDLIFGKDAWKIDEYCGQTKDNLKHISDDIEVQSLLNESLPNSIVSYDRDVVLDGLNGMDAIGFKLNQAISPVCSSNSWGYADPVIETLADQPHENAPDCYTQLDDLYASIDMVSNQGRNRSSLISGNSLLGNGQQSKFNVTKFHIQNWLQFNSFGRQAADVSYRNTLLLGNYDECMRRKTARFCFALLAKPKQTQSQSIKLGFRVGTCLPKTCSSKLLMNSSRHLAKLDKLIRLNLLMDKRESSSYPLQDLYCLPSHDSELLVKQRYSFTALLVSIILAAWFLMLLYSTLCPTDSPTHHSKTRTGKRVETKQSTAWQSARNIFDLRRVWHSFYHLSSSSPLLDGLNGFKVVTMNWLMVTHIYLLYMSYVINTQDLRDNSLVRAFIYQGQHGVSTFFIISGILAGYKHFQGTAGQSKQANKLDASNRIRPLKLLLLRYIRVWPLYFVCYVLVRTFSSLLGDGPLWDHAVSIQSEARQCQLEPWFVPLLLLANNQTPMAHCIVTGWHISNDVQIYLVLPLLLIAYQRSLWLGRSIVVLALLLTHSFHVYQWHSAGSFLWEQLSREPFSFGSRIVVGDMALDYVSPLGRIGTYFLGICLADLLMNNQEDYCLALKRNEKNDDDRYKEGSSVASSSAHPPQTATIVDKLCVALGFVLTFGTLSLIVGPHEIKDMFGAYSKAVSYPMTRLWTEMGWAILLHHLLRHNLRQQQNASWTSGKQPVATESSASVKSARASVDYQHDEHEKSPGQVCSAFDCLSVFEFAGKLLKLRLWDTMIKLNYSLMLTHFTVARYVVQSQRQLIVFSWIGFAQYYLSIVALAYPVALIVHLTIEVPLMEMLRVFVIKKIKYLN